MALLIENQPVPLEEGPDGVIRVGGTRVTLDSVVYCFHDGATAEEIVYRFPSLELADVYAVLAFYLHNQSAVQTYVSTNEVNARQLKGDVEQWFPSDTARRRLLSRRSGT